VSPSESIDAARTEALDSLLGRHGIIGVGRTANALVFFVRDAEAVHDEVYRWSAARDVPVEIRVVASFRPAAS
jgi:hypothetical protein